MLRFRLFEKKNQVLRQYIFRTLIGTLHYLTDQSILGKHQMKLFLVLCLLLPALSDGSHIAPSSSPSPQ